MARDRVQFCPKTIFSSQTWVQRPALGLKKSGRCSKVVVIQRLVLKNYYTKLVIIIIIFFLLLSSFDSALVDIPCIVSGIGSIFFPLTYTLDLFAAALHVHKCTKAHLDFDPQLLSIIVYVSFKSLFTIETIQLKYVKVLKSWKIPTEKFRRYQGLNPGLQLPIMTLMHILLNSIDAGMKFRDW